MDAISSPIITVNDEPIAIVPNSVKFKEGKGEQKVRAASTGGGEVEQVFSDDVETNFGMVSFEVYPTAFSIKQAREWKSNRNNNVVGIAGFTPDGASMERTFQKASLPNDYEVPLGSETTIELEFKSNAAV
jgi:hypothetical protein